MELYDFPTEEKTAREYRLHQRQQAVLRVDRTLLPESEIEWYDQVLHAIGLLAE